MHSLARSQIIFTLGLLTLGCLEAAAAGGWLGFPGVEGVVYSVVLCLVPGWLTIFVAKRVRNPEVAAYVVLLGTGLRVAFVLAGLFAVRALRPELGFREFEIWLIVGYLVALGLETWIVVANPVQEAADRVQSDNPEQMR